MMSICCQLWSSLIMGKLFINVYWLLGHVCNLMSIIQIMKQDCVKTPIPHKPLISQCVNHQSAHQPGVPLALHPRCTCCHLPYVKKPLSFCFSLSDIHHLGSGPALFFNYLIICAIVILIPTLSYSIITLLSVFQTNPSIFNSSSSFLFALSNLTLPTSYSEIQSYILAVCNVVLLILIPVAVRLCHRTIAKLNSPGFQYYYTQPLALLIELERQADYTEEQIKKTINEWYHVQLKMAQRQITNDEQQIVKKVYFHFNMDIFQAVQKRIDELEAEKYRMQQQNQSSFPFESVNLGKDSKRSYSSKNSHNTVTSVSQKLDQLKQKIKNKELQKANKFIIILKRMEQAELMRNRMNLFCKSHVNQLMFSGDNLAKVSAAPFPSDIRFDFVHMSATDKTKRRVISWVGTTVLVLIGISLQYLSYFVITKFLWSSMPTISPVIMSLAVYFISNFAIVISNLFVSYELHSTKSSQDISNFVHSFFILLTLRCIGLYIVFLTYQGSGFSSSTQFCETVSWLMIIWPILDILFKLLNPSTISHLFKNIQNPSQQSLTQTQAQLNKQYQKPENKLHNTYAEISTLILSSLAFSSISSICLITCSIYILLELIIQRVAFIHVYSQPSPSSYKMFITVCFCSWKALISIILGHFYLIYFLEAKEVPVGSVIKIIYSGLLAINFLVLLVPHRIFQPKIITNLSYQHIQSKIINCYSDFNPVYCPTFVNFTIQPQKSLIRYVTKNQILVEQLNTMSKSLEQTLRDRLFNQKHPCLEALNNRQQDSLYFQYDAKVSMPEKKPLKSKVPPIFKQNREDLKLKKNSKKNRSSQGNLVKLTNLVNSEQEDEIKKRIKTAIKDSINKIT